MNQHNGHNSSTNLNNGSGNPNQMSGDSMHGHMMDSMVFFFGFTDSFLFKGWSANNPKNLTLTCLAMIIIVMVTELLRFYESKLNVTLQKIRSNICRDLLSNNSDSLQVLRYGDNSPTLSNHNFISCRYTFYDVAKYDCKVFIKEWRKWIPTHINRVLVYTIRTFLNYIIMLAFMTFNSYICISIIFAFAMSNFFISLLPLPSAILATESHDCC